ncbi:Aldehyde dehydrogenase [Vanrija pseudolonga]|uniref:Aldehyde dehydrogenase n=1 Tax=Vanrija pseudolonga TaxID=143232 RepID=A0AAF0Y2M6_9TREE|nr:Aldehyde dehydrogenase [Vanrija pseudolonga]
MSRFTVSGVSLPSGLFINNEWVQGHGERLQVVNPATEEQIAEIETASREDVDLAVAAARAAFESTWGTWVSGQERGQLLFKLADLVEANIDELAVLERVDGGKPAGWARVDIVDTVACFRYFAGAADKIHGSVVEIDDQRKHAVLRKEPIGVVAQIVPWNYPLLMMAWKVAPALSAGCAIVFKAAEQTPLSTLRFAELVKEAGYPAGAFNLVNGVGAVTGETLSRHLDIDKIAFTGSTATGRRIAVAAAESNLKKVTLELGGKSANIVFAGANLPEAAKWAAFGVYENMGQSCSAGSRVLVQESVYDEFVKLFVAAASAFKVGPTEDEDTFQGPQISKVQFDKILGLIEAGKAAGAKCVLGGARHGTKGYFIQPTVFTDVDMGMRIAQEEIFGPVASIIKFKDEAEAIAIANATEYGLAAAVHTTDYNQVNRVTRRLKAGTVWVNQYVIVSHQIPFGGYKQSGWGRELGMEGLEPYLTTKSVHHYYDEEGFEWPIRLSKL